MKKNTMTAILSVAMIGCLAVGGTFALLTANSGKVTNTFAGAQNLGVTISETATDKDTYDIDKTDTGELASGAEGGITYTNVLPAAVIDKHPVVHVKQNTTDTYVFIKVTGLGDANIDSTDFASTTNTINGVVYNWTAVADHTDVYTLTDVSGNAAVIDSSAGDVALDVFTTVNVVSAPTTTIDINDITVTAQTVQATGTTYADALTDLAL